MTTAPYTNKPIIWTISGADCSGGAGIAADIKTGHTLGCEVCHLSTANTVQNSKELVAVNPVAVETLALQAETLWFDKTPAVIKIGLIASFEQVTWLVAFLSKVKAEYNTIKIVYDPVGQASAGGTNGGKFSDFTPGQLKALLPLIDIITPNSLEAQQLAAIKQPLNTNNITAEQLALAIISLGAKTVVVKGGHQLNSLSNQLADENDCVDYCLHTLTPFDSSKITPGDLIRYQVSSKKVPTDYSHGGGCTFASAMSCFIAHGYLVRDALTLSKAFINQGMHANKGKLGYYGAFEQTNWPEDKAHFPTITDELSQQYQDLKAFPSLSIKRHINNAAQDKLGLYPVIDSLYWLKRLLPLNLNIIQLRVKNKPDDELEAIIIEAVELAKAYPNTRLFINDYWQLAIKHGAYGVHIGQEDLQTADLKTIQASGIRLGISTHGCYEFLLTQQLKPSYLAMGAIFPTKTKNMIGQIQGIDNLKLCLNLAADIPVVAIGGINHERAVDVCATGTDSIAVVTAITETENPESSVERFQILFK